MIVIPPLQNTSNNTSSNVPEPSAGEVVWVSSTTYNKGQVVIRTETHRKYECQADGTTGTPPEQDPQKWLDVGPTNKWAMFDSLRSSPTINQGTMTVVLTPGKRIDSLAIMGVKARKVTVTGRVSGQIVYGPIERGMNARNTTTWSQYFFGEFNYKPSMLLQDLPPYTGMEITVEFENDPALNVECTELIVGSKIYLGTAQYNAVSDSLNFSRIERTEFGGSILKPRRTVPKVNVEVWAKKELVNQIRAARTDLNAVPALWSALDDEYDDPFFEAVLIYGIYKQFEINISGPSLAVVTLELEEM